MKIIEIIENKKSYLPLLLLADEQEYMIDRYLNRGHMYALKDKEKVKGVIVVTDEGDGVLEIKNLAVAQEAQRRGFGRYLIEFIKEKYRGEFHLLQVGTGDSPLTVPFYKACGFTRTGCIPGFFTDHYDHPIFEGGVQLVDMIYFSMLI